MWGNFKQFCGYLENKDPQRPLRPQIFINIYFFWGGGKLLSSVSTEKLPFSEEGEAILVISHVQ